MEDNRRYPQDPGNSQNSTRRPTQGYGQNPQGYRQPQVPRTPAGQPQYRQNPMGNPQGYQSNPQRYQGSPQVPQGGQRRPMPPQQGRPRQAPPASRNAPRSRAQSGTYRPGYSYGIGGMRQRHRRPTPFIWILIVFAIILLIVIFTSKGFRNFIGSFGETESVSETESDTESADTPHESTDEMTDSDTEDTANADTTPPPENEAFLICIDPGHGFDDVGTSSELLGGLTERDVTLLVAKEIYNILLDSGYNVMLSHDGETIPVSPIDDGDRLFYIDERVSLVNSKNVDLFVSVHCDSFPDNTDVYGTRIYYCSENKYSDYSADLVTKLKDSLDNGLPDAKEVITYPRELSSAYYVTAYTECPSALIELGFVTNESDAQKMLDETWRHEIAFAIANAISSYMNESAAE